MDFKRDKKKIKVIDFYKQLIKDNKDSTKVYSGTDPLGFDFAILDYICYVGLIFKNERSSKKNNNKKKYPNNKFNEYYIISRLKEEYDIKNMKSYVPINVFSQSLHELRGLNSKITGHIENMMGLTDEENWAKAFDDSSGNLKKVYVGSRLTKFILDNTKFYNQEFLDNLKIDKQFSFVLHKSIYKIVKIYENDFKTNKYEISIKGNTYRKLLGEREYFEILIKILIENAMKYSTDERINSKIEIEEIGNSILIKICSYGRLIPKEDQKNIFSRGFRSTIHHNSTRGTGMGLYIGKNIAKLYDIELNYEAIKSHNDVEVGWNNFNLMCKKTYD